MRSGSGRTVLAVTAGYVTNAVLVGLTQALFVKFQNARLYFVVDLLTQIEITIIAGCLCCLIARQSRRTAAIGMAVVGLVIGTASLVISWSAEPHWYGIALLFAFPPCVWAGYALVLHYEESIDGGRRPPDR